MITLEPPRKSVDEAQAWSALGLSRTGLTRYLNVAQAAVGLVGEVDVLLAGDRTVRRLNREFRGKDKATDVLSFPASAELAGMHAGDLAVSVETAARQAKEHGHALRDEVRVLLLHGLLHLAGMDHEVDGGEMAAREDVLRAKLRLKRGLIARAGGKTNATVAEGTRKVREEKQVFVRSDRGESKSNDKRRSSSRMTSQKKTSQKKTSPKKTSQKKTSQQKTSPNNKSEGKIAKVRAVAR